MGYITEILISFFIVFRYSNRLHHSSLHQLIAHHLIFRDILRRQLSKRLLFRESSALVGGNPLHFSRYSSLPSDKKEKCSDIQRAAVMESALPLQACTPFKPERRVCACAVNSSADIIGSGACQTFSFLSRAVIYNTKLFVQAVTRYCKSRSMSDIFLSVTRQRRICVYMRKSLASLPLFLYNKNRILRRLAKRQILFRRSTIHAERFPRKFFRPFSELNLQRGFLYL